MAHTTTSLQNSINMFMVVSLLLQISFGLKTVENLDIKEFIGTEKTYYTAAFCFSYSLLIDFYYSRRCCSDNNNVFKLSNLS